LHYPNFSLIANIHYTDHKAPLRGVELRIPLEHVHQREGRSLGHQTPSRTDHSENGGGAGRHVPWSHIGPEHLGEKQKQPVSRPANS
jgi:hypothetical protein